MDSDQLQTMRDEGLTYRQIAECTGLKLTNIYLKLNSNKNLEYLDRKRFGGNRAKAIERDKDECQFCGMDNSEHQERYGRSITVDHWDGDGRNSDYKNNRMDNLITLCLPCHSRKDMQLYMARKGTKQDDTTN